MKRTVCLDFDGVLHGYTRGWDDGSIYDVPVPGALVAVKCLADDYRLVVSTCREDIGAIWEWLKRYGIAEYIDDVTNAKPVATVYIDDRAVRFEYDWDSTIAKTRSLMEDGVRAISGPGHGAGGGG